MAKAKAYIHLIDRGIDIRIRKGTKMNKIYNNYMHHQFKTVKPIKITTPRNGEMVKIELPLRGSICFTRDLKLYVDHMHGYIETEVLNVQSAQAIAHKLGFVLHILTPEEESALVHPLRKDGELQMNLEALLSAHGVGPDAAAWRKTDNGLVYYAYDERYMIYGPKFYSIKAVAHEVHLITERARQWIHDELRGFKRHVKLDDYKAIQLWKVGKDASIIFVKLGESFELTTQTGQKFGSGGAWSKESFWGGKVRSQVLFERDTGFVSQTTGKFHFTEPGAMFVAAGDDINGGRTFYRKLYVTK